MKYKLYIIIVIIIINIFFLLQFIRKKTYLKKQYIPITANVIEKIIESDDCIEKKNVNNFKHIKKFRLKVSYIYYVDDISYSGYYYNDGLNENFLDDEEYILINKDYSTLKTVMIYYDKNNNKNSYVNYDKIIKEQIKIYYVICIICIFMIIMVIFY